MVKKSCKKCAELNETIYNLNNQLRMKDVRMNKLEQLLEEATENLNAKYIKLRVCSGKYGSIRTAIKIKKNDCLYFQFP